MQLLFDPDVTVTDSNVIHTMVTNETRQSYVHMRTQHGLILRLGGNTHYKFDDHVIVSKPGDVMFLSKGLAYTLDQRNDGECIIINFSTLDEYEPQVRVFHPRGGRFEELFRRALRTRNDESRCGEKAALYEILFDIWKLLQAEYFPDSKVQLLVPAMEAFQCGAPSSMADLAKRCGISETYFRQLFKNVYGKNPAEYFLGLRVDEAKRHLHHGASIGAAAAAVGFTDASYFTKVFRRVTGMLPCEYQRELEL